MFTVNTVMSEPFLMSGVSFSMTSRATEMVSGTLICEGGDSIRFVCFEGGVVDRLKKITAENKSPVCELIVTIDEYKGELNAKLQNILSVRDDLPLHKFVKGLDVKGILRSLSTNIKENVSEEGRAVIKAIMTGEMDELKVAMASMLGGYHDGVPGGLLNHIKKLFAYGQVAMETLNDVLSQNEKDLFFIGLLVHDLGKLIELENGAYSKYAIVPHTYWGIQIIEKYKNLIVETYGEMFFVELMAIIMEHHGEFGEHPKSVYAYLVHVVDLVDSRVSGLEKVLKANEGISAPIKFDNFRMEFNRY